MCVGWIWVIEVVVRGLLLKLVKSLLIGVLNVCLMICMVFFVGKGGILLCNCDSVL